MRKTVGAVAVATALMAGGGHLWAMDYRVGVQMRTDGSWSPVQFRYSDYSDERAQTAHVLEIDGKPAAFNNGQATVPVGDVQITGAGNAGAYEDGFAFWGGGIDGYRFQPLFQATSNNGAFTFGARFMIKNKPHDAYTGNGWSMWLDYKQFELKAATVGNLGYGAYVGTGGNFLLATSALYAWEMTETGKYAYFKHYWPGDTADFNYFGYQISNAGLGVENISDNNTAVGIQWTQPLRGTDTLNVRLVNLHNFSSGGFGYYAGRDYDTTFPVGWNVQANYRMPAWAFSGTFKIRGANQAAQEKYEMPESFNIAGHVGVSTTRFPNLTLSAGYAFIGEAIGDEVEIEAGSTLAEAGTYSVEFWGHNVGLSAAYRLSDWTINFDTTASLMMLSDFMKARSSKNRYGWRPYVGATATVSAHKRINGLMTGHVALNFTDANMNSYTDGKAEASFALTPSVDISPARGVNVNVALALSLQNFSDQARGWWSDYNSDGDFGHAATNAGAVYYTYPYTFHVSIPISLSISI